MKPTKSATAMMPDADRELPYEGAKEMLLVDDAEVHSVFLGSFLHFAGASAFRQFKQQRVEEVLVELLYAELGQL